MKQALALRQVKVRVKGEVFPVLNKVPCPEDESCG
jgi:hypothetical protein